MREELKRFSKIFGANIIALDSTFQVIWWHFNDGISLNLKVDVPLDTIMDIDLMLFHQPQRLQIQEQHLSFTIEPFYLTEQFYFILVENFVDFQHSLQNKVFVLEEIIEHLDEGIIVSNKEGDIIYYNEALAKMEEHKKEDMLGRKLWDAYNYQDRRLSEHNHILKTAKPIYTKYRAHAYSENEPKFVGYSSFPIQKDNQTIGVFSITHTETSLRNQLRQTLDSRHQTMEVPEVVKRNNGTIYTFQDIKGNSQELQQTIIEAKNISIYNTDTLIVGETGTGKELFAQSMHNLSPRVAKPFVAINCAAIPPTLLESTLFGSVKGAFTGATTQEGLFEYAKDGTLFLDEINSLPMGLQSKLMRVLQERAVRRVGSNTLIPINCTVISASNEDPELLTANDRMRLDLFYRIAHSSVYIPPLRERPEDVLFFIQHFLHKNVLKYMKSDLTIKPELYKILVDYDWPGNVRELEHLIENLVIHANSESSITEDMLPRYLKNKLSMKPTTSNKRPFKTLMHTNEEQYIREVLKQCGGNISAAAKQLNISRQSLQYHMKKLAIRKEDLI
ncbi:sigma-54-dependent Fis family transcriptional regulator [Lysinibacillus sp. BPa_S21]|uniref:sigma-54 interaction domain-containing protein n=1 Tax=Lysinibacillus sp. BPa_S21 TaxID=2932478 RepID=UPI0020113D01|nr:sigma 54-interacting transcriptional regulator [Lysinibacillus sp. BPa_S21]MCL1694890.1 sigma 54-interacting transcriptional regulator [Lysinibacillus sp. BPa_S21]